MTEMQSAIGRIQLGKLDDWVETRRANAMVLAKRFAMHDVLRIPLPSDGFEHSFYKFYAFVQPDRLKTGWSRDRLIHAVSAQGVPCFHGSCSEVYREKAFVDAGLVPANRLPVARDLGECSLMFPVHPTLSEDDMHRIADAVDSVLAEVAS